MLDPLRSSGANHQGPCPDWCLNDECAESGDDFHASRTTSVQLAAGGATLVELHQDYGSDQPLVYVVVEGHRQAPAVERMLTPAEARSVAAHLLHHADVAEGLGQ